MKPEGRLNSVIRREILQCLREKQEIQAAARVLGIGRQTLHNKIKALQIARRDWQGVDPSLGGPVAAVDPGLMKELADLLARYSTAIAAPPDPFVLGEFYVPANGCPAQRESILVPDAPQSPRPASAELMTRPGASSSSAIVTGESTIDLFLRLGIDLRRQNVSKRRNGFWRRFEGELDYLLADARAAFLEKIKLAHPDRGGDSEEAKNLSIAWAAIRRRFGRRGITL